MRICFFSDAFARRASYGLGTYARELFDGLRQVKPPVHLKPFALFSDLDRREATALSRRTGLTVPRGGRRLLATLWRFLGAPAIETLAGDCDLVHSVELGYPIATSKPWVATVHDLGPLTQPSFFSQARPGLMAAAVKQAVEKAQAIIAVSRSTADEIEHLAGRPLGERLHVIHEGVSDRFFETVSADALNDLDGLSPAGPPFFLWTGSLSPRKNVSRVLEAFETVASDLPHHLVLTGNLHWDACETATRLEASPHARRIHRVGHVPERTLRALYQQADAYLFLSLYEGFGLPVLEAMASGCPVITSNRSALPEVAGSAALLVDPEDTAAIAEALRRIASEHTMADILREKGRARARSFSWQKCAEQVHGVYRQVLGE